VSAAFSLGDPRGQHLGVEVVARLHPTRTDYWDGNWLRTNVEVVAGPWRGRYRADLRSEEFAGLRDHLQGLYGDPKVLMVEFDSMEPWLHFTVERSDDPGHLLVKGEARREPFFDGYNILSFALELDQSYLPETIRGLDEVVNAFPVLGSPDD
jgi:hypothetical protein